MIKRPKNLPDFTLPPLDEVVIGVQFEPSGNYSSIHAKDIWELFKSHGYPDPQEQPALDPSFETFGGSNPQSGINFKLGPPILHSRFWFISPDKSHLVQFQPDRFLINWRNATEINPYPRFETIAESFEKCLKALHDFFDKSLQSPLEINQAEVTYINTIPVENLSCIGEWLRFTSLEQVDLEGINCNFSEIIKTGSGKPYARMNYSLQSVTSGDGKMKALKLTLTFRGKPAGTGVAEAMTFAFSGREKIVTQFTSLTTDKAHKKWNRKQ